MATIAELRKSIRTAAARLTGNGPSRGTSNMKKAELEAYLAEYIERLDKARAVDGAYEQEALRVHGLQYDEETEKWVPVDEPTSMPCRAAVAGQVHEAHTSTVGDGDEDDVRIACPGVDDGIVDTYEEGPSADDHLSAGDHRDGCECEVCEFYANDVDPEFAAEVDALVARNVAADLPPDSALLFAPVTETNVVAPDKTALVTLVQFGSKLVWGRLIAVVNRRTKYSSPLLATVEIGGIRRLINADEVLVSDEFAHAA